MSRSVLLRRLVCGVVSVAVVALPIGSSPATGQAGPGSCTGTNAPFAVHDGGPDDPAAPDVERRFATGYFNTQLTSPPDYPDSDGDGLVDQVSSPGTVFTVANGRGELRFSHAGEQLWGGSAGDIDGVPGDELAVWSFSPGGDRGPVVNITEAWVVPGSTPPGQSDPAVVGRSVGVGIPSTTVDRDGDGVREVLLVDYDDQRLLSGSSLLLSGAAIASAPVGGAVGGDAILERIPGVVYVFARFDAASDDLEGVDSVYRRDGDIVTVDIDGERDLELRLSRAGTITTYAATLDVPYAFPGDVPVVFAYQGEDANYLIFNYNVAATMGSRTVWWRASACQPGPSIETPDGTPPDDTAPPAAPPASPVAADARFTG